MRLTRLLHLSDQTHPNGVELKFQTVRADLTSLYSVFCLFNQWALFSSLLALGVLGFIFGSLYYSYGLYFHLFVPRLCAYFILSELWVFVSFPLLDYPVFLFFLACYRQPYIWVWPVSLLVQKTREAINPLLYFCNFPPILIQTNSYDLILTFQYIHIAFAPMRTLLAKGIHENFQQAHLVIHMNHSNMQDHS